MTMINLAMKPEKNCKYYRKCSNNFAADCNFPLELSTVDDKHYFQKFCYVSGPTYFTSDDQDVILDVEV